MRRLATQKDKAKKKKKSFWFKILGITLVALMFLSVLGYGFYSQGDEGSKNKINYNGYDFFVQDGIWYLTLGDFNFAFKTNVEKTEPLIEELNLFDSYSDKPLYISSEDKTAETEILMNLQQTVQRIQYACLDEMECADDFPIKTCDNNFIIIETGEKNEIVQKDNCVFIRGEKEKLLELSDTFLLKILGIK